MNREIGFIKLEECLRDDYFPMDYFQLSSCHDDEDSTIPLTTATDIPLHTDTMQNNKEERSTHI